MQAAVDQAVQADTRLRCVYGEFPVHFRGRPQENLAGMSPFSQGTRHRFVVFMQVANNAVNEASNSRQRFLGCRREPGKAREFRAKTDVLFVFRRP